MPRIFTLLGPVAHSVLYLVAAAQAVDQGEDGKLSYTAEMPATYLVMRSSSRSHVIPAQLDPFAIPHPI